MKEKCTIETIGTLTKEELLSSVDHNIIPQTFVLESMEPFPGYHGTNIPDKSAPRFIFFVIKGHHRVQEIIRINQKIKKYFKDSYSFAYGKLIVHNDIYYCIRVKDLSNFEQIPELQACYKNEGIGFMKKKKINTKVIITLNKHFVLDSIADGIFRDKVEEGMNYIAIPKELNWKLFEKMTYSIRNNISNPNYDAALGAFYRNEEMIDVVRIYGSDISIERLKELQEKYLAEIKNL